MDRKIALHPPEAVFEDEPAGMLAILKAAVDKQGHWNQTRRDRFGEVASPFIHTHGASHIFGGVDVVHLGGERECQDARAEDADEAHGWY